MFNLWVSICECQSTNAAIADDFLGGGGGCMGPSSADHYNRKWYRTFSSEWGNATSILIKWCKSKLPECSRSSDAQETWCSYVASSISDSGFLFLFVHICFSGIRLLHWIALSRKLSWIRRVVIGLSRRNAYRKKKLFKKDFFLMASCIVWQIPFIRLSRPLALLTGFVSCKIQIKRWFLWIRRPVRLCNCSKALHHVRRQEITIVICCLDVLYRWFRNLRYDHIWRWQTD